MELESSHPYMPPEIWARARGGGAAGAGGKKRKPSALMDKGLAALLEKEGKEAKGPRKPEDGDDDIDAEEEVRRPLWRRQHMRLLFSF